MKDQSFKKLPARLKQTFYNINYRCNSPKDSRYKYYGGKGIKNFLTPADLLFVWERDNGASMEKPSIDRIDPDGNYEIGNVRFIELRENIQNRKYVYRPRKKHPPIVRPEPKKNDQGKYECFRCHWIWLPRIDKPTMCPACKSRLWDVPTKEAEKKTA